VSSEVIRFDCNALGLEDLRALLGQVALKPSHGTKQVVIVDNIESLSPTGSNALLKTLEEPYAATILVLIAAKATLLPTIVSRCQTMHFGLLTTPELGVVAAQRSLTISPEGLIAAGGSVARLLELEDTTKREQYAQWQQEYTRLLAAPLFERMQLTAHISGEETEALIARLRYWQSYQKAFGEKSNTYVSRLRMLEEGLVRLRQNANKKLVLEYIALHAG
jgi:DNA polymerase III delta prime subunit